MALAQLLAVASYPTLARRAARGELGRGVVSALAFVGVSLGTALAIGFSILRVPLVTLLFGASFAASTELLGKLAWSLPGAFVSMLLGVVFAALRRQLWTLGASSGRLALLVVGCLLVVPEAGALGCARVVVAVQSVTALANLLLATVAVRAAPRATSEAPEGLGELPGVG
jgi:O-antigen/teichoic acid export membrane protein